jgi:MFS transporter, DHA2 family, multidrug resistance protein
MLKFKNLLKESIPGLSHEHPAYPWWVLWSVMFGTFMAVLDITIVNVGLPTMMARFGTSVDKVEWVLTGYLLIFACILPSSGWIADHFGFKRTYFVGILLFTAGSLLCSFSWNINILIIFRLLQGLGAGLIMPVGMAILTREFPPEKRGVAMGFWAVSAAASVSLGPMIGGFLIDNFSWHAIFDVNVPVGILGLFATWVIQREHKTETRRPFDMIGFLSMSIFLTFFLLALSDGNADWNTNGWTSNFIITCFTVAMAAFIVFIIHEFNTEYPILDLRLLSLKNFWISNVMLFIFGIALFGNSFLLPLFLQNSLGYTAWQAGLVFFPVGILQAIVAPISGWMSDHVNPKIPITLGIILNALSLYLFHYFSLSTDHAQIMLPLYIRGLGIGFLFSPLTTVSLMDITREKMAQASGMFNTIRQIGGSFGVALLGTILTRRVIFHTQMYGEAVNQYSATFKHIAYSLSSFVKYSTGSSGSELAMRAKALIAQNVTTQAFIQGINDDFLIGAIITILLIIPMFFLKINKKAKKEKVEIID